MGRVFQSENPLPPQYVRNRMFPDSPENIIWYPYQELNSEIAMNDFSLSLLESMQLLLMSSSKETASELDTFFTEKLLLFYSAEKYFQSVQALLFLFRRIAILSLPKEKASWQLKALFGFCWITIHPLPLRPSGRPTGLTDVLNIIALGGLSKSFIPVATIWEPLLFSV